MRKAELLVLLIAATVAQAGVRVLDVDVYKNVNGWSPSGPPDQAYVSQSFTCTADSLLWADFFVGTANARGHYQLDVTPYPTGDPIYTGPAPAAPDTQYRFTRANLQHVIGAPSLIKGKTYILKITHSDGDPINFYYSDQNPYKYGSLILPGDQNHDPFDLVCRIEGINRVEKRLQIADSRLQTAK